MAFYLSPLVAVNEIDLTTTIPAVSTSIAAIVLRYTYKGPEKKRVYITSTNELIDTFGMPTNTSYKDILAATGFLRYGNSLYCTRVMPVSASFAGTIGTTGASASFTPFTTTNAYKIADMPNNNPDEFGDVPLSTSLFEIIAVSRGAWGNNIRIACCDYNTYSSIMSGSVVGGETSEVFFSIDSPLTDSKDFLIVVQSLDQGEDSDSNRWKTREIWNVSTDPKRVGDDGTKKFAESRINEASSYIRININASLVNKPITLFNPSWQRLGGGKDDDYSNITDALVMEGYDLYGNADEVDVNLLIDSDKSSTVKKYLISLAEDRKDAIAILDCEYSTINTRGAEAVNLRTYRLNTIEQSSSYAAFYGNWLEVYDKWNGRYRWIPASGHVAGIYANTDNVSEPWYAPAGLNRAIIGNVRRLKWNPTLGHRDLLYKVGVNPIVSFAGEGKCIWGQKTLLNKESAFNRINVRRLFMVLEKAISTAAKYFLFEPNDDLTRLLLVNMIDPFLRDVRSRRGIYDFMIVCNETNNTPERIDRNELYCDIYIKPTRTAEFIVLNFIATKTGASFTEIAAARS